jgi:hypothetical protein
MEDTSESATAPKNRKNRSWMIGCVVVAVMFAAWLVMMFIPDRSETTQNRSESRSQGSTSTASANRTERHQDRSGDVAPLTFLGVSKEQIDIDNEALTTPGARIRARAVVIGYVVNTSGKPMSDLIAQTVWRTPDGKHFCDETDRIESPLRNDERWEFRTACVFDPTKFVNYHGVQDGADVIRFVQSCGANVRFKTGGLFGSEIPYRESVAQDSFDPRKYEQK